MKCGTKAVVSNKAFTDRVRLLYCAILGQPLWYGMHGCRYQMNTFTLSHYYSNNTSIGTLARLVHQHFKRLRRFRHCEMRCSIKLISYITTCYVIDKLNAAPHFISQCLAHSRT